MPPPVRKGAISVAFVRPSVCLSVRPSVAYIANNSRTQRPSVPKFGRKVPHHRCDSHTSFKVKRSKVRVTRSINADTHRAPDLPNAKAYELIAYGWRPQANTNLVLCSPQLQPQRCVECYGFNIFNWCSSSEHSVIANHAVLD